MTLRNLLTILFAIGFAVPLTVSATETDSTSYAPGRVTERDACRLVAFETSGLERVEKECLSGRADSLLTGSLPFLEARIPATPAKCKPFLQRVISPFARFFFDVDTAYVHHDDYNFQALFQNDYSYDSYKIKSDDGKSISFRPEKSLKLGPYIGWSFIFIGVTVDVFHIAGNEKRQELDLSLYTLPFVLDIYYRKNGGVYNISRIRPGDDTDTSAAVGADFHGIDTSVRGFDLYYIFNHRKFSYPATFNQSTQQRRSAGSPLAGIGFTRHTLTVDWDGLTDLLRSMLGDDEAESITGSLRFDKITYTDVSVWAGYAYNFVFAKYWLAGASLNVGMSYKHTISDNKRGFDVFGVSLGNLSNFRFSDVTFDFMGRLGIVYNTGKWFAGVSATVHSYNYSTTNFSTNNSFGSVKAYVGLNFGRKHAKPVNK
ncbi:MAG: DUF4421 domain-containing protein [Prevotella sp.]|nr:DUF4421 domain-containing protein [Prevotella sp.]